MRDIDLTGFADDFSPGQVAAAHDQILAEAIQMLRGGGPWVLFYMDDGSFGELASSGFPGTCTAAEWLELLFNAASNIVRAVQETHENMERRELDEST